MIRIAVLSEQVTAQIREAVSESTRELDSVQVVFSGTSSDELRRRGLALRAQVLVVDLALISKGVGSDLGHELEDLLQATGAELALVLYSFTRREVVQQLNSTRSRAIKAPVSLATLRLNMLSLLVKDALRNRVSTDSAAAAEASGSGSFAPLNSGSFASLRLPPAESEHANPHPHPHPPLPPRNAPFVPPPGSGDADPVAAAKMPRVFNQMQLGRLQEIKSAVRCECPSHMAELVSGLTAFEEYSRKCENAGDEDAKLHGYLYQQTSRARRLMEEALLALCRYERLEI